MNAFFLSINGKQVAVLPKPGANGNEPFCILLGNTIHRIRECRITQYALEQTLRFNPEERWPKCPRCSAGDWSLWVPIQFADAVILADLPMPAVPTHSGVHWHIMCMHCASVITTRTDYVHYAGNVDAFYYDPEENRQFVLGTYG